MKTLPADTLLPPLPDKNQIAENEAFWSQAAPPAFAPIERAVAPADPNAPRSWGERWLDKFHVSARTQSKWPSWPAPFTHAAWIFGVCELQRAGELEKAAAHFTPRSSSIPTTSSPESISKFNESLRAGGKSAPVDLSKTTSRPVRQVP
jgi:hypothetical protein